MRIRNTLLTSAAALLCAASVPANALSLHTWVSGAIGNDSTCTGTRTAPCATFQQALSLTAAGGTISVADPGDFGPVTIAQSVTVDGGNMGSVGFGGHTIGIYVNAPTSSPTNVVLRNLAIDGQGTGSESIQIAGQVSLTVDGCKLEGFYSGGISLLSSAAENVLVTNTVIDGANVASVGMIAGMGTGPDVVALDHVTIKGVTLYAVSNESGGGMQVTNSVLTQSNIAVLAQYGSTISVANTAITANQTGVCSSTGSKIRLDTNDIYDSTTAAIANCGGQIKTSGTNRTSGAILIPASLVSDSVLF
jgi:hypothetical protein